MPRRVFFSGSLFIVLVVFLVDQFVKSLIESNLFPEEIVPFGPIDLTLIYNPGLAFGASFLPSEGILLLSLASTVFFLTIFLWFPQNIYTMFASGFIFGGALSNVFDRLTNIGVVDYIRLGPSFPVFNLADTSITIGLMIFLFYLFTEAREEMAARRESAKRQED